MKGSEWLLTEWYPVLRERFESNGDLKSHYFHEDLTVARRIFENKPQKQVDVGSRVDGFVAHVASFREIEVFDIRPQNTKVKNIRFVTADFMNVPASLHNYTDSLSSLNVVEHFGLGRFFHGVYGSELNGTPLDKTYLLADLLKAESLSPTETIMIGDRAHDVLAAKINGIPSIGVLWGYGSRCPYSRETSRRKRLWR